MTETSEAPKAKRTRKAAGKKKADPTEYVVLMNVKPLGGTELAAIYPAEVLDVSTLQDGTWVEVDRVTAHGQEKPIIEKWANEKERGGVFKLCPARSWKGGVRIFEQKRMTSEPLS